MTRFIGGIYMKVDTTYYEKRFSIYPDLVDLLTFRKMLGGIGDTFARRLIRENRVNLATGYPRNPSSITY